MTDRIRIKDLRERLWEHPVGSTTIYALLDAVQAATDFVPFVTPTFPDDDTPWIVALQRLTNALDHFDFTE